MTNFFDITLPDLETAFENMGLKRYRAHQVYKWVYLKNLTDFDGMTNLSKSVRLNLKELFCFDLPQVKDVRVSKDGSTKFGLVTSDGRLIEAVLMPEKERNSVCVSTQIGCKMACRFCVTGRIGFVRDLSVAEIVGQVMAVRSYASEEKITNIVFMGMGEPLDNLDNVLRAIEIFEEPSGLNISRRRVTVSTAGLIDGLKMINPKRVRLAISLNAARGTTRTELMPINRVYPLQDLIGYVRSLGDMGRDRVTFEYVMLRGVNDSLQDARLLLELLRGVKCKVNIIPFNESPYCEYRSPDPVSVTQFQEYLMNRKLTAIVRDSRGRDIAGGCGQLGMKYLEEKTA